METEQQQLQFWQENYWDKDKSWFTWNCILKPSLMDGEWPEMQPKLSCSLSPETTPLISKNSKKIWSISPKQPSAQSYLLKINNTLQNLQLKLYWGLKDQLTCLTSKSLKSSEVPLKIHSSVMVWFLKKKFQLDAKDLLKTAKFWHLTHPWTMIKLKYMEQELEWNHLNKFSKSLRLKN